MYIHTHVTFLQPETEKLRFWFHKEKTAARSISWFEPSVEAVLVVGTTSEEANRSFQRAD